MTKLQNEFQPDCISPPGDTFLEVLESLGMTQAEVARRIGVSPMTVSRRIHRGLNEMGDLLQPQLMQTEL